MTAIHTARQMFRYLDMFFRQQIHKAKSKIQSLEKLIDGYFSTMT